jgi:hypothetical protein
MKLHCSAQLTQTAHTVTPRKGAPPRPELVLILRMDVSCVLRRSKAELAPVIATDFAIGMPMLEVGTRPGSKLHFPGVAWDGRVLAAPPSYALA